VEQARGHVDVAFAFRTVAFEEAFPVPGRRLVGARVGRGHLAVHRHADALERCGEEIRIGVRERDEVEATAPQLGERARDLGERLP
jgi:hypothetical protein